MKKLFGRRILSTMLSLLTVISYTCIVSPHLSSVTNAASEKRRGGAVEAAYFKSGTVIAESAKWIPTENTTSAAVSDSSGEALRIYSTNGSAGAMMKFDEGLDIKDHKEAGIYLRSLSENDCTVILTVDHSNGKTETAIMLPVSTEEYYVFVPIPKNSLISSVSINISASDRQKGTDNSIVSAIIRNPVLSSTDHSENIEKFSAFNIEGLRDGFSVSPNKSVTAAPLIPEYTGEDYALKIKLSGSGGGIALHFAPDGENFGVSGSSVLTKGRSVYIFKVGKLTPESAYKIEFTGIDNSDITLEDVQLLPMESSHKNDKLGTITKCVLADDTVYISGNITRDAAVKYIDGRVCLYEVPMWTEAEAVFNDEPVESIKMSTSFSFALPITEDYSAFTSYTVAIKDKSGVHILSDPIFPTRGVITETRNSSISVSGISADDAFIKGYDNCVIDIDVSSLFLKKSSPDSDVFYYDGYSYYPDKNIVSDISKKAHFLSSAGMGILFRMSDDSNGYIPIQNDSDCRKLAAISAYLSEKFAPRGFIPNIHIAETDIVSYRALKMASAIRLICAAAGPAPIVYIPIDASNDGESFIWFVSEYMSDYPKSNYEMLLSNLSDSNEKLDSLIACAADGGYSSAFTLIQDSITEITISSSIPTTSFSYIIDVTDGAGDMSPVISSKYYETGTHWSADGSNTLTLWDFTSSYGTEGFTVAAGQTKIHTAADDALEAFTDIPACRALKTVLSSDSGPIIAEPSAPMNLGECPSIRFLMSAVTDTPFTFDIIFVSGKNHAVFSSSFDTSGVYAPVCDLSYTDISNKIDRIAIVLRDGGPLELSIATVTAAANGNLEEIMESLYITEAKETTPPPDIIDNTSEQLPTELMTIGGITVITLVIFIALSRKKSE